MTLTIDPDYATLKVACAGHPAPIVVPRVGQPTRVDASGHLLGMEPSITLHTAEVLLRRGDSLVAYTDGVTDQGSEPRRSPEQALGGRGADANAEQLAAVLEHLARDPIGRHPDDIAILVLQFLGSGASRSVQLGGVVLAT